jgi:hypothetical protein
MHEQISNFESLSNYFCLAILLGYLLYDIEMALLDLDLGVVSDDHDFVTKYIGKRHCMYMYVLSLAFEKCTRKEDALASVASTALVIGQLLSSTTNKK